jgi:hypothetical protein
MRLGDNEEFERKAGVIPIEGKDKVVYVVLSKEVVDCLIPMMTAKGSKKN